MSVIIRLQVPVYLSANAVLTVPIDIELQIVTIFFRRDLPVER